MAEVLVGRDAQRAAGDEQAAEHAHQVPRIATQTVMTIVASTRGTTRNRTGGIARALQGLDLLGHHHRAHLGGDVAGKAGQHDRAHQRPQLAEDGQRDDVGHAVEVPP